MTSLLALRAVIGTELRLRARHPSFPLLVAVVVSMCALLVPAPTASYTTVTVNGQRLLMSADASLTAAAIVLSILLLPVFALSFDVGTARDAEHGLDQLHLTTPVRAAVIAAGRLLANLMAVLAVAGLALLAISSTIYARSLGLPSPSATAIFLLIVVPVAVAAVALGALFDRYLGRWAGWRTFAAFAVWFAAMLAAAVGGADLFGVAYLRQVIVPGGHPTSLSVGAVSTHGLQATPWTFTPLTHDLIESRAMLALLLGAVVVAASMAIRFRLGAAQPAGAAGDGTWITTDVPASGPARVLPPAPTAGGRAQLPITLYIVVKRWFARSRMAIALVILTVLLATRGGATASAAIAAALVIPAAVVSKTSKREVRVAATLEATTSALIRPTPTLTYCWMLALVAIVAALPALVRTHPMQAVTAVCGVLATTMWLTWTHRCAQRPVLGTATFGALWYLSVFNHPPAGLDVFGLWGASAQALLIAGTAVACALALVVRHERG